jgi:hypothetical protein
MADEKPLARVVWILGSGFSVGLGGPMLKDLLHPKTEKDFRSTYPTAMKAAHTTALNIYKRHHPDYKAEFGVGNPTLWQHAEEFLDFLDCARVDKSSHSRLFEAHFGTTSKPTDLHRAACQIVGAECLFTDLRSDLKGEAWQPYLRWARWLTENDTIVTFNYDRVLDMLAASESINNDCRAGGDVQRLTPKSFLVPGVQEPEDGLAKVYKLHGSVDWVESPGDATKVLHKALQDSIEEDQVPLIAAPGPTKDLHSTGVLATTWNRALAAIREANVIVFMGYRFPPSDSESRRKLLDAIGQAGAHHLRVHTVLGPRKNEDDTVRLAALLETSLGESREDLKAELEELIAKAVVSPKDTRRPNFRTVYRQFSPFDQRMLQKNYELFVRPLYVQDFLTVQHKTLLVGPHMDRIKPKPLAV